MFLHRFWALCFLQVSILTESITGFIANRILTELITSRSDRREWNFTEGTGKLCKIIDSVTLLTLSLMHGEIIMAELSVAHVRGCRATRTQFSSALFCNLSKIPLRLSLFSIVLSGTTLFRPFTLPIFRSFAFYSTRNRQRRRWRRSRFLARDTPEILGF